MVPFLYLAKLAAQWCRGQTKEMAFPKQAQGGSARVCNDEADTTVTNEYGDVSNQLVATYVRNNPKVPTLDLSDATSLSNQALWAIADSCAGHQLGVLKIRGCKHIDDDGLMPIAEAVGASLSHVEIDGTQVTVNGVAKLAMLGKRLHISRRKAADVRGRSKAADVRGRSNGMLVVADTVADEIKKIMGDKDEATHGKLALLLHAFPEHSSITLPYSADDEVTSSMVLVTLKKLTTLIKGGLQLDERKHQISVDLTVTPPDGMKAPGDWLMGKHFELLFSIRRIKSLNLQDTNMCEQGGAQLLLSAAKADVLQGLTELNVSNNGLGATEAKQIVDALYVSCIYLLI
jgi:hypothetical protein